MPTREQIEAELVRRGAMSLPTKPLGDVDMTLQEGDIVPMPMKPPVNMPSQEAVRAELDRRKQAELQPAPVPVQENGGFDLGSSVAAIPQAVVDAIPFGRKAAGALGALGARAFGVDAPLQAGVDDAMMQREQAIENAPVSYYSTLLGTGLLGGGALAGTKAARALGSLGARGGLAGKIATGGLAGEATQRLYEAGETELGKEGEALAREGVSLGGILGAAFPVVGAAAGAAGRALTPTLNEGADRFVSIAKKYNVPLGIDDLTSSGFYQHLIQKGSKLPFSGANSSAENQLKSYTQAFTKELGLPDGSLLTPKNLDKAFEQTGKMFDDIPKNVTLKFSDDALDGFNEIESMVSRGAYGEGGKKIFDKFVDDIFGSLDNDVLSPDRFSKLRNQFSKIARTASNQDSKSMARDFENVLIDMIGDDAPKALRNAKNAYKKMLVAEKLNIDPSGLIQSPASVRNAVKTIYKRDFTRGKAGAMGDMADLGQIIKQKVPDSGTAMGNYIVGGMTGGSVPLAFLSPIAAGAQAATAGVGLGVNRLLQSRNVNPNLLGKLVAQQSAPQSVLRLPPNRALGAGLLSGAGAAQLQ